MPYIGKSPLTGNYNKLDSITGSFNGSTTAFNLTVGSNALTPVRAETLLVSLNGVIQQAATDYTVSGTQITFTTAPASSDTCFIIAFGEKLDIGTPSDATVTSAKLASTVLTGATDIGAGIADADLFLVDDGAGGTLRKTAASRIKTYAGTDLTAIADGAVGSPSLANSGDTDTGIYFPAANTVGVVAGGTEQFRFGSNPIPGGSKNLLINGDFAIWQRGTSITGVTPGSEYHADQWQSRGGYGTLADRYTVSKVAASGDALAAGHYNAMRAETTTAEASPNINRYSGLANCIDHPNAMQLAWGTASAKDVTISFWVRSSETGTHGFAAVINAGASALPTSYTISSADTWEKKTITITGNTATALSSSAALRFVWLLQLGSSAYSGTQNTWGSKFGYTAVVDIAGTTSRYLELAGVQVEVGDLATDFAFEHIGTTLRKCQRYFQKVGPTFTASTKTFSVCTAYSTSSAAGAIPLPVTMRTEPTVTISAASDFYLTTDVNNAGTSVAWEVDFADSGTPHITAFVTGTGTPYTITESMRLRSANANTELTLSAEL